MVFRQVAVAAYLPTPYAGVIRPLRMSSTRWLTPTPLGSGVETPLCSSDAAVHSAVLVHNQVA